MIKKYLRILSPTIVCCCLFITTASARVCFLPDSKDCGQSEITNVVVTCESQGGYDSDIACTANKKPSLTCYQNNECYFRKCQYDSELECKNEVHTNKYNCKSEKIDEQTTCYYSTVKTCAEIDAEYKDSYNKETQVVEDTIQDANGNNCYKTRTKYCSERNANYRVSCPSLGGEETGVFGKDGACLLCYTCADKGYTEIGSKNSNCWDCEKCPADETKFKCEDKRETYLPTYAYTIVHRNTPEEECRLKTCKEMGFKTKADCTGTLKFYPLNGNVSGRNQVTGYDGVCGTCGQKTCKDYNLVAESECDTSTNTFNQDTSVPADIGICGTCVKKEVKTCEQIGKENSKNYIDNSGSCAMGTKTAVDGVKDTSNNQCYYCNYSCYDYNDSGLTTEKYIYENEKCTGIQRKKDKAEGKYDSEGNQCYICKPELTPFPTTDPVTITITYYAESKGEYYNEKYVNLYKVKFSSTSSSHTVKFKLSNFGTTCNIANKYEVKYPVYIKDRDDDYTLYGSNCGCKTDDPSVKTCNYLKVDDANGEHLEVIVDNQTIFEKRASTLTTRGDSYSTLFNNLENEEVTKDNITLKFVKGNNKTSSACQATKESDLKCGCPTPRKVKISEGCYGCAEPLADSYNQCGNTINSGTGIGSGIGSGSGSGGSMFIQ